MSMSKTAWSCAMIIIGLVVIDGRFGQYVTELFCQLTGQLIRLVLVAIMGISCMFLFRNYSKFLKNQPKPFPNN